MQTAVSPPLSYSVSVCRTGNGENGRGLWSRRVNQAPNSSIRPVKLFNFFLSRGEPSLSRFPSQRQRNRSWLVKCRRSHSAGGRGAKTPLAALNAETFLWGLVVASKSELNGLCMCGTKLKERCRCHCRVHCRMSIDTYNVLALNLFEHLVGWRRGSYFRE